MPEFELVDAQQNASPLPALSVAVPAPARLTSPFRPWQLVGTAVILLLLVSAFWLQSRPDSNFARFWSPFLSPRNPVLVAIPDGFHIFTRRSGRSAVRLSAANGTALTIAPGQFQPVDDFHVTVGVLNAMLSLQHLLMQSSVKIDLNFSSHLTAANFQNRSVVVLGAVNQVWSPEVNQILRFSFVGKETSNGYQVSLLDRNSAKPIRQLDNIFPWETQTKDFAIITWLSRGQSPTLSIAGLNLFGTEAAARFLTDPAQFEILSSRLPSNWAQRNLQVVLENDVVNQSPVNPRVVAVHSF